MEKRKILAVTGARSDYDLLYTVYKKLHEDKRIDFQILITGPHLSEKYGLTAQFVEKDGFIVADRVYNLIDSDKKLGRAVSIGNQISGLAQSFNRIEPDIVLVAGDREESISVALTGAYLDIPVAHFFGGDIAKDGNIDNSTRYAASKYAHIHFPSLEEHKQTLLKLGEEEWRIFPVGNPAIDRLLSTHMLSKSDMLIQLGNGKEHQRYCVLIQHSIITQVEEQKKHIRTTLDSILEYDGHCFINYPNSDAGSDEIIKAYQEYSKKYPEKFTLFQNLDRIQYVSLLNYAEFLIGNSSSGVVEVGSLGLPAINIGMRQRGRLHGENVIFVDNDQDQIVSAMHKVRTDEEFKRKVAQKINPYGDGKSGDKVVKILSELVLNDKLKYKNITY
ncbi:MAG: UDP-N-acetylglucosamine 2-epimerase [Christiangramia sp.]|nr:UDP-N-acetylglucosamine 2-epimerase [Christiangramia sp.]